VRERQVFHVTKKRHKKYFKREILHLPVYIMTSLNPMSSPMGMEILPEFPSMLPYWLIYRHKLIIFRIGALISR
jgi:hypothetical protein